MKFTLNATRKISKNINTNCIMSLLYRKNGVYRGIHYFLILALKHRLWVLVRTASVLTCTHNLCFEQKYENSHNISTKNCHFYSREKLLYVAWEYFLNDLSDTKIKILQSLVCQKSD